MSIDVEVSHVPMHPFAHPIRQPPDSEDVASTVEDQRIGLAQPLAGRNFIFDREKTRVVSLKCVRASHLYLMITQPPAADHIAL